MHKNYTRNVTILLQIMSTCHITRISASLLILYCPVSCGSSTPITPPTRWRLPVTNSCTWSAHLSFWGNGGVIESANKMDVSLFCTTQCRASIMQGKISTWVWDDELFNWSKSCWSATRVGDEQPYGFCKTFSGEPGWLVLYDAKSTEWSKISQVFCCSCFDSGAIMFWPISFKYILFCSEHRSITDFHETVKLLWSIKQEKCSN